MKKMVFFICLLALTAGLSAKNQNRKLVNCQTCGEYEWLVVEFNEKEKILASQTDSVVIIEKSGLSLAKIKSWDKNLSEEEVISAAIKKVLVVDQRTDYLPDGLMPKKIKKTATAFFQDGNITVKESEEGKYPWELLLLLFSALLISAIWAITYKDIYELFFNGGKYFFTVIIIIVFSGFLCGIATLSLLTKGILPIIITISNGAVFGSLFLLVYLFTSYLVEKTSNWLCETFKMPTADNFYSTLVWITILLIISIILPATSSIANTASAVFIILIPGLIAGPTFKALFLFLAKKRKA